VKNTWKEFFTFSRREQGGILVMTAILLGLIVLHPLIPKMIKHDPHDMEEFRRQALAFNAELRKQDSLKAFSTSRRPAVIQSDSTLLKFLQHPFSIDPNKLSEEEWLSTGLDSYVARNIIRYREKGGKFKSLKDVRKIYGMDENWFSAVEPFILIPKEDERKWPDQKDTGRTFSPNVPDYKSKDYKKTQVYIELNAADTNNLDSCTGIGPSFARRIITYRELLGGYYNPDQLLEVKGMDSARYAQFQSEVFADPALIRRIDLNTVTFKEMLRHPYFEYYLVKVIINYRDKKKRIDSVGELKSLPEIYPELYQKISPYLEVR
jgi:competence protein ComEA